MTPEECLRTPATAFTAHRPPALLVDRPVAAPKLAPDGTVRDGGRVRLLDHDGLDALQLCEGAAQSVAVLRACAIGLARPATAGRTIRGLLVGARAFAVEREARSGETVTVGAELVDELGPFQIYAVQVAGADGAVLASGELRVFDPVEAGEEAK